MVARIKHYIVLDNLAFFPLDIMTFWILLISTVAALPFQLTFTQETHQQCRALYDLSKQLTAARGLMSAFGPEVIESMNIGLRLIKATRWQYMCLPYELLPFIFSGLAVVILGIILLNLKQIENKQIGLGVICVGLIILVVPVIWYDIAGFVAYLRTKRYIDKMEADQRRNVNMVDSIQSTISASMGPTGSEAFKGVLGAQSKRGHSMRLDVDRN